MQQISFFEQATADTVAPAITKTARNAATQEKPRQHQSGGVFGLSDEQKAIVLAPLRQRTMIKAFAGAGKTTTLVHKAQHHHLNEGKRGLYLAFNKSAQLEAQSRFGQSAICKTTHGLAFAAVGKKYAHKLRELRPKELADMRIAENFAEARAILETINHYCRSSEEGFPGFLATSAGVSDARAPQLLRLAEQLWTTMCNPASSVPITHDGYLKLFQLSRPRLPGDYLMVDEFQDTNPVVLDIVNRQTQPVIVVGDPYQSIYGWRGAVNAMQKFDCQFRFAITESYRFGQQVADVANELVQGYFGEKLSIKGKGSDTLVYCHGQVATSGPVAWITRTNAGLFEKAVQALRAQQSMAFIGGVNGYKLQLIADAQNIAMGRKHEVQDPFIRSFNSLTEIEAYAEDVEDHELNRIAAICRTYGEQIFELIDDIHEQALPDLKGAECILSTAHKSKGSTLENVCMGDDFKSIVTQKEGVWRKAKKLDPQEVNLTYVAVTRAQKSLSLSQVVLDYQTYLFERTQADTSDCDPSILED